MNKDNNVSECKIGRTTYIVTLVFNPASKEHLTDILQRLIDREHFFTLTINQPLQEHLTDILQRLIDRECEEMLGESGQEPEKQAV